jgi:oligoribonuclease NrnB/cAMP/cGMP phosphodiesterase (DHH superfamily)
VRRTCFYHAGCPDGLGAAWAVWRAWGPGARYLPRGHDDVIDASAHEGQQVVFVDIAPGNEELRALAERTAKLIVLDHHVTARERFENDLGVQNALAGRGHHIHFDLSHSGAMLAWSYFHPDEPAPDLLRYVEDQDLWAWKLPASEEVNAALASYPREFESWEEIAARPIAELAAEGAPILRANRIEIERALQGAHPVVLGSRRAEAVNTSQHRSRIGHELAQRAAFKLPWGVVYRVTGQRVDVSLYSIGDLDVAKLAESYGGGGHANAAGFSVTLKRWLDEFA